MTETPESKERIAALEAQVNEMQKHIAVRNELDKVRGRTIDTFEEKNDKLRVRCNRAETALAEEREKVRLLREACYVIENTGPEPEGMRRAAREALERTKPKEGT